MLDARYRQTVAPTVEPVGIEELRLQCSILDNSWDELLASLEVECREIVERRLSRQFLPATWTQSLDAFPDEISIEVLPVAAVNSIQYVDYAGATQTLATNQYQVDLGSPDRPARIKPVWGLEWPATRTGTYGAVTVTFTAGYDSADLVPAAAKRAIKLLVAHAFKYREPVTEEAAEAVLMGLDWATEAINPGNYG